MKFDGEQVMNIEIELVKKEEKEILRNLLEKYFYEFSKWKDNDVNNTGLYGYNYLDNYWQEQNCFPYFIKINKKLAGFVLVNNHNEIDINTDYAMAEFCVLYKYRRKGIGKYAAKYIFNNHQGKWQLRYHQKNIISKIFWNKIINEITNGDYKIINNDPNTKYDDGSIGEVLIFNTWGTKI
jgi:predicted acetyltransferase